MNGGAHPSRDADVVVVGAGLTGLTLALELGQRGVPTLLVERRPSATSTSPKCKQLNVRTMEHFRRLGVAESIRDRSPLPAGWSDKAVFTTGLSGEHVVTVDNAFYLSPDGAPQFAEPAMWTPQYFTEKILREKARETSMVTFLEGATVMSVKDLGDGVEICLDQLGGRRTVRARYVVGADGGRSSVRKSLGVEMVGEPEPREFSQIVFRAPELSARMNQVPAVQYWILGDEVSGLCGPMELDGTWWAGPMGTGPIDGETAEQVVRDLIGVDVEIDVLRVDPWHANMLLAQTYRSGNVFLAGDAAHLNPPFGGWGANTGIGDGVDLGWKLAGVLQGWLAPSILDTYERERRPVAERVIEQARRNMAVLAPELASPELAEPGDSGARARSAAASKILEAKSNEFYSLGLVLGHSYGDAARPGTPATESVTEFEPALRVGARLPHGWLPDGRSLFDVLGERFTALVLDPDNVVATDVLEAVGSVLDVRCIEDPTGGVLDDALVLVRPDGIVAWHGADAGEMVDALQRATGPNGS